MTAATTATDEQRNGLLRAAARAALTSVVTSAVLWGVDGDGLEAAAATFFIVSLLVWSNFGGSPRRRVVAYGATTIIGSALLAVGVVLSQWWWVAVPVTVVVVAVVTFASYLQPYLAAATPSVVLSFVAGVASPDGFRPGHPMLMGWLVGGAAATVAAVTLWPDYRAVRLQALLVRACQEAAEGTRALAGAGSGPVPLTATMRRIRELLFTPGALPGLMDRDGYATLTTVDALERMERCFRWNSAAGGVAAPASEPLVDATLTHIRQVQTWVQEVGPAPGRAVFAAAREEALDATLTWTALHHGTPVRDSIRQIARLRLASAAAAGMVDDPTAPVTVRYEPLPPPPTRVSWRQRLRVHCSRRGPWVWLALRAGLALGVALLVVHLASVTSAFWLLLGTLTALRTTAKATFANAVAITIGTVIGLSIGWVTVGAASRSWWVYAAYLTVLVFVVVLTPRWGHPIVNQAVFTVFAFVFFMITTDALDAMELISPDDVAFGVLIALGTALLLWPRGAQALEPRIGQTAVSAAQAYFDAALRYGLTGNGDHDPVALRALAVRALTAVSDTQWLVAAQGCAPAVNDKGHALDLVQLADVAMAVQSRPTHLPQWVIDEVLGTSPVTADAGPWLLLPPLDTYLCGFALEWQEYTSWLSHDTTAGISTTETMSPSTRSS